MESGLRTCGPAWKSSEVYLPHPFLDSDGAGQPGGGVRGHAETSGRI